MWGNTTLKTAEPRLECTIQAFKYGRSIRSLDLHMLGPACSSIWFDESLLKRSVAFLGDGDGEYGAEHFPC